MRIDHAHHVDDGTYRYMVAAPNQKRAAELLNVTVGFLRRYGGRYPLESPETALALTAPRAVWKKLIAYGGPPQPWLYAEAVS